MTTDNKAWNDWYGSGNVISNDQVTLATIWYAAKTTLNFAMSQNVSMNLR